MSSKIFKFLLSIFQSSVISSALFNFDIVIEFIDAPFGSCILYGISAGVVLPFPRSTFKGEIESAPSPSIDIFASHLDFGFTVILNL
ncbi:hypothetical protein [Brachyspira intermedia]|uniref:hypothetical protein n=1 Tax=Brachyspira intermedia TaxID=84377 RepID=UPI003004A124